MNRLPLRDAVAGLLLIACAGAASAQSFSAHVTPPRFEASVQAGETYRDVIEIQNMSVNPGKFAMRTADWTLAPDGTVAFEYALQPGSCRPWVGIESPELLMAPNGRRRYRFEVAVPADAPAGQCRFAVMIEGEPQKTASGVAVAGRIGVIVYVSVGDAAAKLALVGSEGRDVDGMRLPFLSIRNDGNAHGRLQGFVDAVDAAGTRWTLAPTADPVMPGATRAILLQPVTGPGEEAAPAPIAYPLTIDGELEWGAQRIPVATTVPK